MEHITRRRRSSFGLFLSTLNPLQIIPSRFSDATHRFLTIAIGAIMIALDNVLLIQNTDAYV